MKNYNEMANDVLRRIGEHETEQRKRRKTISRIVTPLCCFCLVALLGFGMWQGGMFNVTPPAITGEQTLSGDNSNTNQNESTGLDDNKQNQGGQTSTPANDDKQNQDGQISTPGNNDSQNIITTGKNLFAINEITATVSAARKYRDPALHYNETWDLAMAATYLSVDIPKVVENFPDGYAEAGFAQTFNFKYVTVNGFDAIYENNGTLVEDRICYEFTGDNDAKIMILASKLGMPYDCLYSSNTDDITNIRIPETNEIIPVRVYAQGKSDTSDYTLYVGDFEYNGVFYRIRLENLTGKYLDALIRDIVK